MINKIYGGVITSEIEWDCRDINDTDDQVKEDILVDLYFSIL